MSLQKKSEWAEDVACKVTDIIFNRKAGWSGVLEKYLSEKFSQAISNREKEIAEDVEKLKRELEEISTDVVDDGITLNFIPLAKIKVLDEVLSILKH